MYSLLVRVLEDSELAAIAKFVTRDRQHLGCLRVREGALTLEQLYFADEIRPIGEIKPAKARVDKRELDMAQTLIENFAGAWDPSKYKDTYKRDLSAVIKAKRAGKDVHTGAAVEEPSETTDLMAALRASVERATSGKKQSARRSSTTRTSKRGTARATASKRQTTRKKAA